MPHGIPHILRPETLSRAMTSARFTGGNCFFHFFLSDDVGDVTQKLFWLDEDKKITCEENRRAIKDQALDSIVLDQGFCV